MSKYTEVRPLTGEEILEAVHKEAYKRGLRPHYAFDDVVSQACLEMLRRNQRGGFNSVGHAMNCAKYAVLSAYRHITHCRTKCIKNMQVPMPAPELVPSTTLQELPAEKLAYAVIELQKTCISPRYGEVIVNMLNGDSRIVACRKVFKNAKDSTLKVHLRNIRRQLKKKNDVYGVLNAIDESKLSTEIQNALRRIRME